MAIIYLRVLATDTRRRGDLHNEVAKCVKSVAGHGIGLKVLTERRIEVAVSERRRGNGGEETWIDVVTCSPSRESVVLNAWKVLLVIPFLVCLCEGIVEATRATSPPDVACWWARCSGCESRGRVLRGGGSAARRVVGGDSERALGP